MPTAKTLKPAKPRPDFPLTAHNGGKWCRKIAGRIYYFGSWDDPKGALREYQAIADSLQAGIDPRKHGAGVLQVEQLFNLYLHSQKQRADAGHITHRTWRERRDICERVADMKCIGRTTPVVALQPKNFSALQAELAGVYGPVALKNAITRIKGVFKWAFESRHLASPVIYGPDFRPPPQKAIRAVRKRRFVEAAVIRKLLKGAPQPVKAMILLGINGGLGNRDLAALKLTHVNPKSDWLDYPREKTATTRRIPLWRETRKALADALKARPTSDLPNYFVTKYGNAWGWETEEGTFNDEVSKSFSKLVKSLKLEASGLSFYSLRHTFRTVADNATRDGRAIELIMGHAGNPEDMGSHYVEHIDDARLKAVTDAVHQWLFAKPRKGGAKREPTK